MPSFFRAAWRRAFSIRPSLASTSRRRAVRQVPGAAAEPLEERLAPAAISLVSGGPIGSGHAQHSTSGTTLSANFGLATIFESDIFREDQSAFISGDNSPFLPGIGYSATYYTLDDQSSWSSGSEVRFFLEMFCGKTELNVSNSASITLGTAAGGMLYQVVPNQFFEKTGDEVSFEFALSAWLGASQFQGTGAGVSYDYAIGYEIYTLLPLGAHDVHAENDFAGSAPVLTAGGTFLNIEDHLTITAHVGDFIKLNVLLTTAVNGAPQSTDVHGSVSFNWLLTDPVPPEINVDVTVDAQFDNNAAETIFGAYLPGVAFNNTFTAHLTGDVEAVEAVDWQINGLPAAGTATKVNASTWTFTGNMGLLPKGQASYELRVFVRGSDGSTLETYHGTLQIVQQLDYELKVFPGSNLAAMDVEGARFIQGIDATLKFQGTVAHLPSFYHSLAIVRFAGSPVSVSSLNSGSETVWKFEFTRNVGTLPITSAQQILPSEVVFGTSGKSITDFGDEKETTIGVKLPAWLASAQMQYDDAEGEYEFRDVTLGFDRSATVPPLKVKSKYQFTGKVLKALNAQLAALKSRLTAQAHLGFDASLNKELAVEFQATTLVTRAVLFNVTVWDETYGNADLDVGGTLDPISLNATTFHIALKQPALLAAAQFINKQLTVDLLPSIPKAAARVELSLGVLAQGSITGNCGIEVAFVNGTMAFVPTGTFLALTATPQITATAGLNADVLAGWLLDVEASAGLDAQLPIAGLVSFQGPAAAPQLDAASLTARLILDWNYRIKGKLAKVVTLVDYDSAASENGGPGDDHLEIPLLDWSRGKKNKQP